MGFLGSDVSSLKVFDFSLRLFVIPLSVASICVTVTNKDDNSTYGNLEFKNLMGLEYMVCISAIAAGYSLFAAVSLLIKWLVTKTWIYFVADQILAYLLLTSMSGLAELLYLADNGDQLVSWSQACDSYGKFCDRIKLALALHAVAVCCFVLLAVVSAYRLFRRFEPPFVHSKEAGQETI